MPNINNGDELLAFIRPYVTGWMRDIQQGAVGASGAGGGAPSPHLVDGIHHNANGLTSGYVLRASGASTFAWARLGHGDLSAIGADDHHAKSHVHLADGSGTVAHSSLGSIGANDHHAQAHVLSGADHTASDLTAGQVLRASGASTFGWAAIQDGDLPGTIVRTSRQVGSGMGLSGGGDLSADRTLGINLAAALTWTGATAFQNTITSRNIVPEAADTYNLGAPDKPWNAGYISSQYSTLFVQNVAQLFGGYLIVPKDSGTFAADVGSADTTINFGKVMTVGDIVLVRALDTGGAAKAEYISVGTLVSGTTYNVTRDLAAAHVTDPAWPSGTAFAVLGTTGNGRIEFNATVTPRMSIIRKTGTAYNAETEVVRVGDLNGIGGIVSELYGLFAGDYAGGTFFRYEPNGGMLLSAGAGKMTIDGSGLTFAEDETAVGSRVTWKSGSTVRTQLYTYLKASQSNLWTILTTTAPSGYNAITRLNAFNNAGALAQLDLISYDSGDTSIETAVRRISFAATRQASAPFSTPFKFSDADHANLTASTELVQALFDFSPGSIQFATGALATQRTMLLKAPTYSFVGASTLTNAATLAIDNAPVAGTNATITNPYAIWIQAGKSRFDGQISSGVATGTAPLVVASTTAVGNLNADLLDGKHASELTTTLFAQTATVTSTNADTNEHTLTGSGTGSLTLAANALAAGKTVRLTVEGYKTNGGNSDTATFKVKLGSVVVCSLAVNINQPADGGMRWVAEITCRTAGASGTVFGQLMCLFSYNNQVLSTKNTTTSTVDTTGTLALDFTITHSTTNNAETVGVTNLVVEII